MKVRPDQVQDLIDLIDRMEAAKSEYKLSMSRPESTQGQRLNALNAFHGATSKVIAYKDSLKQHLASPYVEEVKPKVKSKYYR